MSYINLRDGPYWPFLKLSTWAWCLIHLITLNIVKWTKPLWLVYLDFTLFPLCTSCFIRPVCTESLNFFHTWQNEIDIIVKIFYLFFILIFSKQGLQEFTPVG